MSEKDILSGHQSLCDKQQKRIVSKEKRSSHTAVNENRQLVRQYLIDGDRIRIAQGTCEHHEPEQGGRNHGKPQNQLRR